MAWHPGLLLGQRGWGWQQILPIQPLAASLFLAVGPARDVNVIPTRGRDNGWIFWSPSVVVRFSPLSQAFHGKAHPGWGSEREGFHSQSPLSTRRLTLGPDGRASLQPGSTHEATRGVSGRCWPQATHGHPAGPPLIWPSCAGALELIHKNVPFRSDWLPVTS